MSIFRNLSALLKRQLRKTSLRQVRQAHTKKILVLVLVILVLTTIFVFLQRSLITTLFAISSITAVHGFVNVALHAHRDPAIKLYGNADDLTIMGPIKVITPFFLDMRDILKPALHSVEVNIRKTCLIILQIHDMPRPQCALDAIRQQLPALAHLPLQDGRSWLRGFSFRLAIQISSKIF